MVGLVRRRRMESLGEGVVVVVAVDEEEDMLFCCGVFFGCCYCVFSS